MGGKFGKKLVRVSPIFEVWQAHPRTILVKVTPGGSASVRLKLKSGWRYCSC